MLFLRLVELTVLYMYAVESVATIEDLWLVRALELCKF